MARRILSILLPLFVAFTTTTVCAELLPNPISETELRHFERWLILNDDQRELVSLFHREYAQRWAEHIRPDLLAFYDKETAIVRAVWQRDVNRGERSRELYPDLLKSREALRERIVSLDEFFLGEVEALLDDAQMMRMNRVRQGRQRLHLTRLLHELPEGQVDVVALIDRLPLSDEEYRRIEKEFINDFEPLYLAALRASVKATEERQIRYWEVYDLTYAAQHGEMSDLDRTLLHRHIGQLRERFSRGRIAASERLASLNRNARMELLLLLPQDAAQEFHDLFQRIAYPQIYPDPCDQQDLYRMTLDLELLEDSERISVQSLLSEYIRNHAMLSERMEEAAYYRNWATYAGRPGRLGTSGHASEELRERGMARELLNRRQFDLIRAVLAPERHHILSDALRLDDDVSRPWDPVHQMEFDRRRR